jgi:hypothetical protein
MFTDRDIRPGASLRRQTPRRYVSAILVSLAVALPGLILLMMATNLSQPWSSRQYLFYGGLAFIILGGIAAGWLIKPRDTDL